MSEKLEQYRKMFGESFPMIPLGWGRTDKEVEALIDKCLKAKKNAYDLGLVKEDDDILY